MSPSRSIGRTSGLVHYVGTGSNPPSPIHEDGPEGRNRSGSLSFLMSPTENAERTLLGSPAMSFAGSPKTTKKTRLSYLKQENLQLRNELNYEIGQKDQLLRHIGTIHRNRVQDTVLEEELQNLYHLVRSQKTQIKSLKEELEATKTEARQSKSRQAAWQADLSAKLKAIREEKKAWGNEERSLKIMQKDREELIEKLERQLDENASELFELREQVKLDAKKVEAIHEYEDKIRRLETCLRFWHEDMHVFERQNGDLRRIMSRWEEMNMLVEAGEGEIRATRARMEVQQREREDLERRLEEADKVIAHLAKRHQHAKTLEKITLPQHSSSREDGDKLRMKRRMEELEGKLLDAKAREEEWHVSTRTHPNRPAAEEVGASTSLDLLSEHDIAPLSLGEAVLGDGDKGRES